MSVSEFQFQPRERILGIDFKINPPGEYPVGGSLEAYIKTACPQRDCPGEGYLKLQEFTTSFPNPSFTTGFVRAYQGSYARPYDTYCPECGTRYRMTKRQLDVLRTEEVEFLKSRGLRYV